MDRHVLAGIGLTGSALDCLGALYLAYDLLGGEHGPLRTLTRGVTYSVIFGLGFGIPLGLVFGVFAGLTWGPTIALEYAREASPKPRYVFWAESLFSLVRGIGLGAGTAYLYGIRFGVTYCVLSTLGQMVAYRRGVRPGLDYHQKRRPHLSRRLLMAAVVRTAGYMVAGLLSGLVAHKEAQTLGFGIEAGLVIGLATALGGFVSPYVEWWADHLPERRLGAFGIILILIGFVLGSAEHWAELLDLPVK